VQLIFVLFKYFPYGGLQRDMLNIAAQCIAVGHRVTIFCRQWEGDVPPSLEVVTLPVKGWSNHTRERRFVAAFAAEAARRPHDLVVGFNKMPGLDCYYAADSCYLAKVMELRGPLSRLTPRFRQFRDFERAVFGGQTQALMISANEIPVFQRYYGTPDSHFHLLPPGIRRDRNMPADYVSQRAHFRQQWALQAEDKLVLLVGSGFRTKGLDRAIEAIAALPQKYLKRTVLMVVGQDKSDSFEALASRLGVQDRVRFVQGRDDIPQFLWGADLLIHPAYRENTGTVLLEAMVAGLPVLTTDVCGYAHYVSEQAMGEVMLSPFDQTALNQALQNLLFVREDDWRGRGAAFAGESDIYSMGQRAAEFIIAEGERRAIVSA
jgi:UDP-glucose:(heptosyl)LPS alpha-1,3-glucosyltransferase